MEYQNRGTRPYRSSIKAAAQCSCLGIFVFIMLFLSLQPIAFATPLSSALLLPMPQTIPPAPPRTTPESPPTPGTDPTPPPPGFPPTPGTDPTPPTTSPPLAGDVPSFVFERASWFSDESDYTPSVAWGDMDNDGDLDLAVAGRGSNKVYTYDNGVLKPNAIWTSDGSDKTESIVWGDIDDDGDLDLAIGNLEGPNKIYENEGGLLSTSAIWSTAKSDPTTSLAWGDLDNDGDLDLAVGNGGYDSDSVAPNTIYANEGGVLTTNSVWSSVDIDSTTSVAWGDLDNDGDLDLAVGNYGLPNKVYLNEGGRLTPSAAWASDDSNQTISVAWGDVDNDGDLDLAVGNFDEPNKVYLNEDGVLTSNATWYSDDTDYTLGIDWGDLDNDGDLDLVAGNIGRANKVYENRAGQLISNAVWSSDEIDFTLSMALGDVDNDGDLDLAFGTDGPNKIYVNAGSALASDTTRPSFTGYENTSVAWGDVDNDGDLDLAVGHSIAGVKIYLNEEKVLYSLASWSSTDASDTSDTTSVAWGDVDNDGDLDLAVGGGGYFSNIFAPNMVYTNEGGMLTTSAVWSSADVDQTTSVAWGDVDNDGDLDLAAGNREAPNTVYINKGGVLTISAVWSSADVDSTSSVAWGDVDNDGDLDLAVGNSDAPNKVYRNESGSLNPLAAWSSGDSDPTSSVAWGDVDNDGDLDLSVGNSDAPNKVYRNESGSLNPLAAWSSGDSDLTRSVAWGDMDNDGDLDLAVGNIGSGNPDEAPNKVYKNEGGVLMSSMDWASNDSSGTESVAWVDIDNDGDLDLATGNANKVYLNRVFASAPVGQAPSIAIDSTRQALAGQLPLTNFYGTSTIQQNGLITIPYTISVSQAQPLREVRAFYSLNGGGDWQEAVGLNELTGPSGQTQIDRSYVWDVFASGFFGQSDNVVIRLEAHLGCANSCQRAFVATQTLPLRVRGYQARVISDDGSGNGSPVSNSTVFRLPAEQVQGAEPMGGLNQPFLTDASGYLSGRGALKSGDQLVALQPITVTQNYVLYHTSATPAETGLDMFTVDGATGVQELTVSADNPLTVFDLVVSLEWDARKDSTYLEQLQFDIKRTSQLLYDWTNGQAALGNVTIYHDKEKWHDADVRIHATNDLRPHATIGGVVNSGYHKDITIDDQTTPVLFTAGHVEMGAVWNRYGEAGDNLSEDWARTLAHELGHYLFFLLDNYIGFDSEGDYITSIEGCPGVMSDPYTATDSEFHPAMEWDQNCSATLSHQMFGRSDWETIVDFYPWMFQPNSSIRSQEIAGPNTLPLALTQIRFVEPDTIPTTVDVNTFLLSKQDGSPYIAGSGAQAFLFSANSMVDLGTPRRDRVQARNASPGDTLCVYELSGTSSPVAGCTEIRAGNTEMVLTDVPAWQPDVIITPTNRDKVKILIRNLPAGLNLNARLYPANMLLGEVAAPAESLTQNGNGDYEVTIDLVQVTEEAYIRIYDEDNSDHIIVAEYIIGGAPVLSLADGDVLIFSNGDILTMSDGTVVELTDGDTLTFSSGDIIVLLTNESAFAFRNGDTLTFSSGGTVELADGTALTFGNGSALTFGNGGVVITQSDGTALTFSNADVVTISFNSGGALTFGNGGALSYNNGDALTFGNGGALITRADGMAMTFINGDALTFGNGGTVTLADGSVFTISSGSALTFGNGGVAITQPDGMVLTFRDGDALTFGNGGALTLRNGDALTFGNGGALTFGNGGALIMRADGTALTFGNGGALTLSSGSALTFGNGGALTFSNGSALTFGNGGIRAIGVGDALTFGNGGAPVRSGDGRVTIYADARDFAANEFYTLQPATSIPGAPSWTTVVGQAYRITASSNAPDLTSASISINYLGRSIADDKESLLHVYFFDGNSWEELESDIDEYHNRAVADAQGPGIYALMYSIDIPLYGTGWNNFSYFPTGDSTPVPQAFDSIANQYSTVYGYDASEPDVFERWELYDVSVPEWVNDLTEIKAGRGYWINVNVTTTLKLRDISAASLSDTAVFASAPPATYYGQVNSLDEFEVTSDMLVQAWVGNNLCGQSRTQEVNRQIVYAIKVHARNSEPIQGCGSNGEPVAFTIESKPIFNGNAVWSNERVIEHNLSINMAEIKELFMPFISQ